MFSRPLQLFIAICLTLLFFTSMVDRVRVITEMNIIAVISCAYLKQIGFCYFRSKQNRFLLLSCLFCCWYILVLWLSLSSKDTQMINRYNSIKSWNTHDTALSKRLQQHKNSDYHHLFSLSRISRQKCWVLPSSLERYLKELEISRRNSGLMMYEWARYETFKTFPFDSPVMPIRLASNGFYYNGSGDSVTCFSCGLEYRGWREGDSVADIHARLSPDCHLIVGADQRNVGIHANEVQGATGGGSIVTDGSFQSGEVYVQRQSRQSEASSGTTTSTQPRHKYPDHENYHHRMDSFTGWPCSDIIDPEVLVSAGFFYAGFSDCVRCFSCGGGLRNWEYGDGPWEEHARWFPGCTFLREQKGSDFIRQHREVPADPDDEQDTSSTAIVSGEQALNTVKGNRWSENQSHHEDAPSAKTSNDSSKRKTESLSWEKGMSIRSIEQILLPMGFSQADIRTSLERTGTDDVRESTITRLLDDLLEHSQAQDKEQVKEHTDKTMSTVAQEPVGNLTPLTANHSPSELDSKVLQEENSRLIDQLTCKICMDKESNVVFIPCGHMVSCETCAPHIRKCAICRQLIKGRVKAFMS